MIILDLSWNDTEDKYFHRIQNSSDPEAEWNKILGSGNSPGVLKFLNYLDSTGRFLPVLIFSRYTNVGKLWQVLNMHRAKRDIISKPTTASHSRWAQALIPKVEEYLRAKEIIDATKDDFVGDSPSWIKTLSMSRQFADSNASILINGDTGIGKSKLAQAIHAISSRSEKPFKHINIASIPIQLIASELFGYVKGAFTGATRNTKGIFESAEGGTVFLDEIGDLPIEQQVFLLQALEEKKIIVHVLRVPVKYLENHVHNREGSKKIIEEVELLGGNLFRKSS